MFKRSTYLVFSLFMGFFSSAQIEFNILTTPEVQFSKNKEMRWWEWSVVNRSCDSVEVSYKAVLSDTAGLSLKLFHGNQEIEDSVFFLPPECVSSLMLFVTLLSEKAVDIQTTFTSNAAHPMDTCFHLSTHLNEDLLDKAHCFPRKSSGLFRIHKGSLSQPEVLVMDNYRNLLLQNTGNSLFLDLKDFEPGSYIIQIGEEEFVVEKVGLFYRNGFR